MNARSSSIVEYFGADEGHKCGYCRGLKSNLSHGMWAHTMCVEDYENLINRGWRRSGHFCYKPMMSTTCCPQYTIRCNAMDFQLNNSHKKVLKKFRNFLTKENMLGKKKNADPGTSCTPGNSIKSDKEESSVISKLETKTKEHHVSSQNKPEVPLMSSSNEESAGIPQIHSSPRTLEDFFLQETRNPLHRLEIKLVDLNSSEFKSSLEISYQLYVKYQVHVHQDKEEDCSLEQFKRFLVMSPLQVVLFYMTIFAQFSWFYSTWSQKISNVPSKIEYGSFHQQYWIDKELIAVGVIDILPSCLSSVYFFYDPDYSYLSLGTYASLREISFVRQLAQKDPLFSWYYLGFYIHSCPKMYYKGQYKPSYLLCPETYTFHPFASSVTKLECNKYSRLKNSNSSEEENKLQLSQVGILYRRQAITYGDYTKMMRRVPEDEVKEIKEYASLVGEKVAKHMLLYRS